MTGWWISWFHDNDDGPFELHTPWWITGYTVELDRNRSTIVAAVQAEDEDGAWCVVYRSYDTLPTRLERRFCTELTEPLPWEHEGGRFQWAEWMQWPA